MYTFTGLSDGTYTLALKVTDKAGRVSATVTATATVKNYVYLYNNGTTHSLVGSWIKGEGNTVLPYWTGTNVSGAVNSNNIQLNLTGFSSYSSAANRYRAVGYRTQNKIDVSNYSQMCLVYDLVIPSFSHVTASRETSAAGFRFSLTPSTTDWYTSKTADTGFWTQDGNINFSNTTICSSLSSTTGSWYPLFQIDSNASAYGASVSMSIHQLYLIPN